MSSSHTSHSYDTKNPRCLYHKQYMKHIFFFTSNNYFSNTFVNDITNLHTEIQQYNIIMWMDTADETEALSCFKKINIAKRTEPDLIGIPTHTGAIKLSTNFEDTSSNWIMLLTKNRPLTRCTCTYRVMTILHCSRKIAKRHKTKAGHSQRQITPLCYNV